MLNSWPLLVLRSSLFSLLMILSTLLIAPLTNLLFPFPFLWRYNFASTWARFNLWTLKTLCGIHYEVEGLENIPDGNAIIFSKHQSTWETLALQKIFPPQVWVLKKELLWTPFFGWALAALEPIAINRKAGMKAVEQLITQGCERLKKGRWVVIFPEGTRVPPGKRIRYRAGGAILAEKSGYPVIPVAHNAGEYWARRQFIKRPGIIRVVIGPLIHSKERSAADILADAENWIECEVKRISHIID